ncbi:MAG: bifunctional pyr operon transcriptional regulator/uracil phosphoribosyltransferase PyrR [Candidatus Desulfofervidaceae bacterium]|nr:bifunctional pyr operon transcriptional regulator/uracil phosphoribosyltransferase PyrR [Candidatus Desulfofervidaceae bacterium]MDL1969783.1 bifunctional pyr operon transcriptional regulator/uracil phosphoribosyltransferase PyrR [Candidatus Desulfofervidaceae bacterium]
MTKTIMTAVEIKRALMRIAYEILEHNKGGGNLALIGIHTGGAYLAKRLQQIIAQIEGQEPCLGILDINLYRDDWTKLNQQPVLKKTEIPFSVDDKNIVLVDDVIFTGRTIRAAMDAIMDFGRPQKIEVAVLIDRKHRELPILANYVGLYVPTAKEERVDVFLEEKDGKDEVVIIKPQ